MISTYYEVNELILQVKTEIKNQPIIVDITYSGDTDEQGKEISEFEYAQVAKENSISESDRERFNKILENGLEEDIVRFLVNEYQNTSINFSPNEYQF
jgi:hypothetical protein